MRKIRSIFNHEAELKLLPKAVKEYLLQKVYSDCNLLEVNYAEELEAYQRLIGVLKDREKLEYMNVVKFPLGEEANA